jgi:hypothetical protein
MLPGFIFGMVIIILIVILIYVKMFQNISVKFENIY